MSVCVCLFRCMMLMLQNADIADAVEGFCRKARLANDVKQKYQHKAMQKREKKIKQN